MSKRKKKKEWLWNEKKQRMELHNCRIDKLGDKYVSRKCLGIIDKKGHLLMSKKPRPETEFEVMCKLHKIFNPSKYVKDNYKIKITFDVLLNLSVRQVFLDN